MWRWQVDSVSAAEGALQLKVWFRLTWYDPRLAWDPEDYGNITSTYYDVHGAINEVRGWPRGIPAMAKRCPCAMALQPRLEAWYHCPDCPALP